MMERKYPILAITLIILALGLLVLPRGEARKETTPQALLSAVVEKSRYLSVDQVTHRIIENDPTLMLIDLRPADQFKTFSLPGSINISTDSLFSNMTLDLFNQPGKDKILIGNSSLIAEKGWVLLSRYSVNRVFIMKGGMNEWFNTIIKEKPIAGTPSSADLDRLSFRKAARQFFVGSGDVNRTETNSKPAEKVQVNRIAPKASAGGGC